MKFGLSSRRHSPAAVAGARQPARDRTTAAARIVTRRVYARRPCRRCGRRGLYFRRRGRMGAWVLLFFAGLLEVVWAYTMKLSDGFTRPGASAVTLLAMLASFGLLSVSMKSLPLGTAYTVWTGIGAVGAFAVGVAVLGEPLTPGRLAAAAL